MRPVDEPPGADPHAGWCGEGRLEAGPYPIRSAGFHGLVPDADLLAIAAAISEIGSTVNRAKSAAIKP